MRMPVQINCNVRLDTRCTIVVKSLIELLKLRKSCNNNHPPYGWQIALKFSLHDSLMLGILCAWDIKSKPMWIPIRVKYYQKGRKAIDDQWIYQSLRPGFQYLHWQVFFQILHENACYLIQILLIKSWTRQRFIVFFKLSLI